MANILNSPDNWDYNAAFPWAPEWQTPTPFWNENEGRWELLNTAEYASSSLYMMRCSFNLADTIEGTFTLIESAYPTLEYPVKLVFFLESDPNTFLVDHSLQLNQPVTINTSLNFTDETVVMAIIPEEASSVELVYNASVIIVPAAGETTTTTTPAPSIVYNFCVRVRDTDLNEGERCLELPMCGTTTTTTTTTQPPETLPWVFVQSSSSGGG